MEIVTNRHKRQLKYRDEVPDVVLADFDWLPEDEIDGFLQYREHWYHIAEFMRVDANSPFPNYWDGYVSDSFFSGVLIKLLDDGEYKIALYLS